MTEALDPASDELFERLLGEIRGLHATLTKAENALHCDRRTEKLTLHGGIAELRRQRDAAEEEAKALKAELHKLTHGKK